jgi:hypothetical protein
MYARPCKVSWYDGRHPLMTDRDYCMKCKDRGKDALIFCEKCNFYVYCSKACKDADKKEHKSTCYRIINHRKDVERLEQNADVAMAIHAATHGQQHINDENFCRIILSHVRARQRVAIAMHDIANKFFMNRLWQEGNDIFEENVKLAGEQNASICYEYAQGLLNQGRVDEVLSFCIERILSTNQIGNTSNTRQRRMNYDTKLPFSDELLLNVENEAYIIYIYLSYLIKLSSFSIIRPLLDVFNQTDFGRSLAERFCHGPQSFVLSYLVPFSHGDINITWDTLLRTCDELYTETIRLTRVLNQRVRNFMVDLSLFSQNKNILRFGTSETRSNEYKSRLILLKTQYCILNIPDLTMWLKYVSKHS